MIYFFKSFFIIIVLLFKGDLIPSLKDNKTFAEEKIISKKKLPQRRQLYRTKKRTLKGKKKKKKLPVIEREAIPEELPQETIIDSFGKLLIMINRHFDADIKNIGKKIALNIKNNKSIDSEIEKLTAQVLEKKYTDIEKLIQKNIFTIQTYSEKIKLLENTNQQKLPAIPPQKKALTLNRLESTSLYDPQAEKSVPFSTQVIKNTTSPQSLAQQNNQSFQQKNNERKIIENKASPGQVPQKIQNNTIEIALLPKEKQEISKIENTLKKEKTEKIQYDTLKELNTISEKNNIQFPEITSTLQTVTKLINQSEPIPRKLLQLFHPDSSGLKNELPVNIKREYFQTIVNYNNELKTITQNRNNPTIIENQNRPLLVEKEPAIDLPQEKIIAKKKYLKKGEGNSILSRNNNNLNKKKIENKIDNKIENKKNLKNFINEKREKLSEEKRIEEKKQLEEEKKKFNDEIELIETNKQENKNNFEKKYQEMIKKFSEDTKKIENNSTITIKNTPQQENTKNTYQLKTEENKSLFSSEEEKKIQLLEEKIKESLVFQKELEAKKQIEQKKKLEEAQKEERRREREKKRQQNKNDAKEKQLEEMEKIEQEKRLEQEEQERKQLEEKQIQRKKQEQERLEKEQQKKLEQEELERKKIEERKRLEQEQERKQLEEKRIQEEQQRKLELEKKQRELQEQERKQLEQEEQQRKIEKQESADNQPQKRGRINSELAISEKFNVDLTELENELSIEGDISSDYQPNKGLIHTSSFPMTHTQQGMLRALNIFMRPSLPKNQFPSDTSINRLPNTKLNEKNMSDGTFNLFQPFKPTTSILSPKNPYITQMPTGRIPGNNLINMGTKILILGATKGRGKV